MFILKKLQSKERGNMKRSHLARFRLYMKSPPRCVSGPSYGGNFMFKIIETCLTASEI
ncbi:hypothetical protein AB205_0157350 [Aquarana catesbeiana]|uniref:Uncharacterized protein n=1 Tax=Aquarana catesbeiana TaxID=8400 RepID=A0A2G9S7X0_AQUCT|nr:hypothetical protein AB205_0157350 [Aquarana catesbeiana]